MTDTKALPVNLQLSAHDHPDDVAEEYANRLMDELFNGVERALDGELEALDVPAETVTTEVATSPELTLSFSEGGLPAVLLADDAEMAPVAFSSDLAATAADESSALASMSGWRRYWTVNRVLLGAAGVSLLATLALWFYQRQQVQVSTTPAADTAVAANAEFLEYLRRSLDVIAQQAGTATASSTTDIPDVSVSLNNGEALGLPPIGNNTLPPAPVPNDPSAGGSINVIERIYVPYQAPQAQAPQTATTVPSSAGVAPAAGTASGVPVSARTLVGVLELGDRSAALFELDGVTQRVYIGEPIANSGWFLVSVTNDEAVIRRNGEVRSIYIGQQF